MALRQYEYPGDDPRLRLFWYWMNAEVMRVHLVEMMEEYEGRMEDIAAEGEDYRFTAYLGYWFAALFVVVEGFNKCGFRDARVERLINAHMADLKAMRHEMFHFIPRAKVAGEKVISKGNWASELHEAIGVFIGEHASIEVQKEQAAAKRRIGQRRAEKKVGRHLARRKRMPE